VNRPATGVEVSRALARVTMRIPAFMVGALLNEPESVGALLAAPELSADEGAAPSSVSCTSDCPARVMGVKETVPVMRTRCPRCCSTCALDP